MVSYRRVLAVDTSSLVQTVAVLDGDRLLAERLVRARAGHTSGLLASVDGALKDARLKVADLDLLVIGAGPGSFTGLRVGLASLKAIAWAHGKPLWPVSSLEALGRAAPAERGLIVPAFDARKGQLYAGAFRREPGGAALLRAFEDAAFNPPELIAAVAAIAAPDEPVVLLGDALDAWGDRLLGGLSARGIAARGLDGTFAVVRASHAGRIGQERATPAAMPDLATLEPNYQRASEAELNPAFANVP